jgi:hypothetical protein
MGEKSELQEITERLIRIEEKLDGYKELKKVAYDTETRSKTNEKAIAELRDNLKWVTRLLAGAIITGLVGLVFAFIKMGMGV